MKAFDSKANRCDIHSPGLFKMSCTGIQIYPKASCKNSSIWKCPSKIPVRVC